MNLDEEDLKDIRRAGARVRKVNGESLKPLPAAEPSTDGELRKIPAAVRDLAAALMALAKREQEPVTVSPRVSVDAPNVTVKPDIHIHTAHTVEAEVTERDSAHRIKKIRFTVTD